MSGQDRLSDNEINIRTKICEAVFNLWPNAAIDPKKAEAQQYSLTDSCTFWYKILKEVFNMKLVEWENKNDALVSQL